MDVIGHIIANDATVINQFDLIDRDVGIDCDRQWRRIANITRLIFHFHCQCIATITPDVVRREMPAAIRASGCRQYLLDAAMLDFYRDEARI
ncbi:hypothetical protein SAEN8230_21445 [Salmonella enterica subsp. arizonae]